MKPFRELSRRGWLFRLKGVAATALAHYGLDEARLRFIQYNENTIYRVDVPGPIAAIHSIYLPNRYVLRIHAIDDNEAVSSELTWLSPMYREGSLPVPAPVATGDQKLLDRIVTPCFPNGRIVSLLRWLDGRKFKRDCDRGIWQHSARWWRRWFPGEHGKPGWSRAEHQSH